MKGKEEEDDKNKPGADPDEDFFKERGIDDPEERDAIRKRASVLDYHEYSKSKRETEGKNKKKKKPFGWD